MQTFTNAEVQFLSQGHRGRDLNWAQLDYGMKSSCPAHLMQRILEARAKTLGADFVAFQHEQRQLTNPSAPYQPYVPIVQSVQSVQSLAEKIEGLKLW